MREQIGKYFIDVSKLVIGGVVISAIMQQEINFLSLIILGCSSAAVSAGVGFFILLTSKNK